MTRYDRYGLSTEQQQQQQPQERTTDDGEPARRYHTTTMTDDESLLLERANAEREETFLRYEQRGCKATDASWEDPEFLVYAQTDRYGFLHKDPATSEATEERDKLLKIEMARVKKWVKMHSNWSSSATKENLRRRVMKGIPDRMRSAIWRKLLDLDRLMQANVGVYERMLQVARERSPDIRQIDFDVNRQFRNHIFYCERYSVKQQSLFRVLAAYSMYNTEIGYCQGMSTVAAVLLMYFDEEDTFWALEILMINARYAMHGLYIVGFPKLMRFLAHHDKILAKCLPKLKKHLDKHEVHSVLYSLKWFFVIFIERIPFSLCLRVWDIYMMFGERVLTAMAFNILKMHRTRLLRMKDMDQVTDFLMTSLHKQFGYSDDDVIKSLQTSMEELKRLKLLNLPPAAANELPTQPRGQPVEPSTKAKIGHRDEQFSEREIALKEKVLYRSESKNEEDGQYNNNGDARGIREHGAGGMGADDDDDDERTEKDYDDITEDTVSHLNTGLQRMHRRSRLAKDEGSITKHSLTGTSVTSTNDISLTSYDRTCDIFRLQAHQGGGGGGRDASITTSAVLLLDQLAAQLSDEELSSYGGATVDLLLDSDDPIAVPVVANGNGTGGNSSSSAAVAEQQQLPLQNGLEFLKETPQSPAASIRPDPDAFDDDVALPGDPACSANDEEDEDELTEKQLSF